MSPVSLGYARERPGRIAFLLAISLALGLSIVRAPAALALLLPSVVGLLVLVPLTRRLTGDDEELDGRRVLTWTVGSFIAHLLFGVAVMSLGGLVSDVLRGPDSITYNAHAISMVRHWTGEGMPFPDLPAGKEGYYYLLAAVYWALGAHVVGGLAVNATLIAAVVPLMTDTTRRLFGPAAASRIPPLVVVLPGMFLWSSQLGKEAAVLLLIAVAANSAVRLVDRVSVVALIGVTASISLLFTFRGWVALTLAGGVVAGIALSRPRIIGGLSTGATAVGALVVLVLTTGVGYSGYQEATKSDLKAAQAVREELALTGRTGYDEDVDISTGAAALSYLPVGMARLAIGPFPWQLRGTRQLPGISEVLVWWLLLPFLWFGVRRGWELVGRRVIVMVAPAFATAILLSLSIGNYGTQLRERLQVVLLLLPFIALGLALRAERAATDSVPSERHGRPDPRRVPSGVRVS